MRNYLKICLNINWNTPNPEYVTKWKKGQTGFPIVDAAMRQLLVRRISC